ncbi:MAG: hypothetical protein V1779_14065, partial [bacterium]
FKFTKEHFQLFHKNFKSSKSLLLSITYLYSSFFINTLLVDNTNLKVPQRRHRDSQRIYRTINLPKNKMDEIMQGKANIMEIILKGFLILLQTADSRRQTGDGSRKDGSNFELRIMNYEFLVKCKGHKVFAMVRKGKCLNRL